MIRTLPRFVAFAALLALPCFCADWNKKAAADYLDSRQRDWFAWSTAQAPGGACFSCHTGFTYLLARPALRRALGERAPTPHENALLDGLRERVSATDSKGIFPAFAKEPIASQTVGVEAIFAALFLAPEKTHAFDRMWPLQISEGKAKGAWEWFSLNLDPWETPDSRYYGASVAALAAGMAPVGYLNRPEVHEHVAALTAYLHREYVGKALHHRLMTLWASAKLPEALSPARRQALMDEIWSKQRPDGGWTMESLGPWQARPTAKPDTGSNAYATAYAAIALQKGGAPRTDRRLVLALNWLTARQDRESGAWSAPSMNKVFEAGSMQSRFMDDAATAFAALALLEGTE